MESVEEKRKTLFSQNYGIEEKTEEKGNESNFFSPKQMSILKRNTFVADWQMYEEFPIDINK